MIEEKVIQYIASTQPQLEKQAMEKKAFMNTLKKKLASLRKNNCISDKEYNTILKEAEANISNVFKYLDVPSYNYRIGTPSDKNVRKSDPLMDFAFS